MTHSIHEIYGPDPTPEKCRESVSDHQLWTHYGRCSRNGTVTETINGVEMRFCKQHSAAARKKREYAQEVKRTAWMHKSQMTSDVITMREFIVNAALSCNMKDLPVEIADARREYEEALARLNAEREGTK